MILLKLHAHSLCDLWIRWIQSCGFVWYQWSSWNCGDRKGSLSVSDGEESEGGASGHTHGHQYNGKWVPLIPTYTIQWCSRQGVPYVSTWSIASHTGAWIPPHPLLSTTDMYGVPDPDMALVFGSICSTVGFPPWQLRLTEIQWVVFNSRR